MPKQSIAFHHPDISSLAKSLKGILAEDLQCEISHVKLLNALAKSGGHQNFQALRAAGIKNEPSEPERLSQIVLLECRAGRTTEIFPTASDGTLLDRRHVPVDTFKVYSNVEISLGNLHGAVGVTVEVPIHLVAKRVKPERSLAELAINHLLVCAIKGSIKPFGLAEARFDSLNPSRLGQVRTLETDGTLGWFLLPPQSASLLRDTLSQIADANDLFHRVSQFLFNLAFSPNAVVVGRAQSERVKACEEFLRDYVERCYAGMVTSWHNEKLPSVSRALRSLAAGRKPDGYDMAQFQRNINHFQLTDYWRAAPMLVPELALQADLEGAVTQV